MSGLRALEIRVDECRVCVDASVGTAEEAHGSAAEIRAIRSHTDDHLRAIDLLERWPTRIAVARLVIGYVAYQFAVSVPASFVTTADPYVAAAFPLLSMLAVQLWHRFVNQGMNTISIKATSTAPGSVSAEAQSFTKKE